MKNLLCFITVCLSFSILLPVKARALDKEKEIALVVPASSHPRILYGAEQLTRQLEKIGYAVSLLQKDKLPKTGAYILVCKQTDDLWKQSTSSLHLQAGKTPGK